MQTLRGLRKTFVDYFVQNNHTHISSSSLIPHHDPTLMFTNAGMVQFKDIFTGRQERVHERAVTSQKCVRAGGKHNDLDNVGYTARHHTFFEMLGNFSFGDYFKEQAIYYAWDLITRVLGLEASRLWITVYHEDEEAYNLWQKISSVSKERIVKIATNDNFWSMGDTGPCGPCTEIFYDYGDKVQGGPPGSKESEGDRYVEVWNLVFMQYDQRSDGRHLLPNPCVDTGMGLERISSVLQGVLSNFETDLFRALIDASMTLTKNKGHISSHRVIADHLRAMSFLIADGVLPSNEGRGYVLRRIMRRGMRHRFQLGIKDPIFHVLFDTLEQLMGQDYPELTRARALIKQTIYQEEEQFSHTLDHGMALLNAYRAQEILSADVAFKLYDTFGFPLDMTMDIVKADGHQVDVEGFNALMKQQKERSKRSWSGSHEMSVEDVWFDLSKKYPKTEFVGYGQTACEAKVLCLLNCQYQEVSTLKAGEKGFVILDKTPFYATSGGQVGDGGFIDKIGASCSNDSRVAEVSLCQKQLGLYVHNVALKERLSVEDNIVLHIDTQRRFQTSLHHSATHLLHHVLKQVLGDHVSQKGSLVESHRLRFDFSHFKALSSEELSLVEAQVNELIASNHLSHVHITSLEDAMKSGVVALFGEKYEDEVRCVQFGASKELCGGTHVSSTGLIGGFKIVSESSCASGVRRIEAVCGNAFVKYFFEKEQLLKYERDNLLNDIKKFKRQQNTYTNEDVHTKKIGDILLVWQTFEDKQKRDLKGICDNLKKRYPGSVILLCDVGEKITVVMGSCERRIDCVEFLKVHLSLIGGKGVGGRPDLVQSGGNNPTRWKDLLMALETHISNITV